MTKRIVSIVKREPLKLVQPSRDPRTTLRLEDVTYCDETGREWTVCKWQKDDGVSIIGVTDDSDIVAMREHRYVKTASGHLEPGQTPLQAAKDEFEKETGCVPDQYVRLATFAHDSVYSDRGQHLYLALGCKKVRKPEEGIVLLLLRPYELWDQLVRKKLRTRKQQKGLFSTMVMVLAFEKLGIISINPNWRINE